MATKKSVKKPVKNAGTDRMEKAFMAALETMEKLAKERVLMARDPLKIGSKMADQIRSVADRLDDEVQAEGIALTEAGYTSHDLVGVGIGVL
jgi:hypothetical protein